MRLTDVGNWKEIDFFKAQFPLFNLFQKCGYWVLLNKSENPEFDTLQTIQRGMKTDQICFDVWGITEFMLYLVNVCFPKSALTVLKCIWSVSSWALLGSLTKSLPPYSLMYLLFKSVILIFIATFCECLAPIWFIKEKYGVWKHRIVLLKSLQTRQSERLCRSLYPRSFYHVSIFLYLSIPADWDVLAK